MSTCTKTLTLMFCTYAGLALLAMMATGCRANSLCRIAKNGDPCACCPPAFGSSPTAAPPHTPARVTIASNKEFHQKSRESISPTTSLRDIETRKTSGSVLHDDSSEINRVAFQNGTRSNLQEADSISGFFEGPPVVVDQSWDWNVIHDLHADILPSKPNENSDSLADGKKDEARTMANEDSEKVDVQGKVEVQSKAEAQGQDDNATTSRSTLPPDPLELPLDFRNQSWERGITLDELTAMAMERHPAITEQRWRVDAAQGEFIQAGLPYNPVLQYRSDEVFDSGATGLHSVNVSQRFVTGNKLALAQRVQTQEIRKRQQKQRTVELTIRTEIELAFANTLIAQRRVDLSKSIQQLAKKSAESVQSLLEAGEVSKVALMRARVAVEIAEVDLQNATSRLSASRRALAAAAGIQTLPSVQLTGDLVAGLDESPWQSLMDQIITLNPELAEAGSELHRAQSVLCLAAAQVTPDVTGQFGLGVDTVTDDTFASIGVSVPLPIRNRNQGNIRSARANVSAASAAINRKHFELAKRLSGAVARYDVARQRYFRVENNVIPLARQSLDLSLEAFDAGETNYLELLTAQRSLFNTRLDALNALQQARQALAEIKGQLVTLR